MGMGTGHNNGVTKLLIFEAMGRGTNCLAGSAFGVVLGFQN